MIDYPNLRSCYITAIHIGVTLDSGYEEAKRGNGLLHKFCENCVDNSNYSEQEKQEMKQDLELVKETLSMEIDLYFHKEQ